VRYPNGPVRTRVRTQFYTSDLKPEPGSEVFVLMKVLGRRAGILPLLAKLAQMVARMVTITVVTKR
jgi:hypothetical protein